MLIHVKHHQFYTPQGFDLGSDGLPTELDAERRCRPAVTGATPHRIDVDENSARTHHTGGWKQTLTRGS
jgi:hypothetical protein